MTMHSDRNAISEVKASGGIKLGSVRYVLAIRSSLNRKRPEPLFNHTTIDQKTGNSRRRV